MDGRTRSPAGSVPGSDDGFGYWFRWRYLRYVYWPACLVVASIAFAFASDAFVSAWGFSLASSLGSVGIGVVLILAISLGYHWLWPEQEMPAPTASALRQAPAPGLEEPGHPLERRW